MSIPQFPREIASSHALRNCDTFLCCWVIIIGKSLWKRDCWALNDVFSVLWKFSLLLSESSSWYYYVMPTMEKIQVSLVKCKTEHFCCTVKITSISCMKRGSANSDNIAHKNTLNWMQPCDIVYQHLISMELDAAVLILLKSSFIHPSLLVPPSFKPKLLNHI